MIRVGILGAKGYASGEALRWLLAHPEVQVTCLMGRVEAPEPVAAYHPWARGLTELSIVPIDVSALASACEAAFVGLPHTTAQQYAPALIEAGVRVIDLSADFRFDSVDVFEATYGVAHLAPDLNSRFVYALPELFADQIARSEHLACPGCYPTAALLELAPLAGHDKQFDLDRVVVNAISGVSGAGRKVETDYLFSEVNESLKAYGVGNHRHRPEIEEKLARILGRKARVTFTPHLAPVTRGIVSTATIGLAQDLTTEAAHEMYHEYYRERPFVRVLEPGRMPTTGAVARTNFCDIGLAVDEHSGALIVVSAIDNLAKGAASQGIQAMNLCLGLPETLGLLPESTRKSHV